MDNKQWIEFAAAACQDAGINQNSIDIITTWEHTYPHSDNFRHNAVFRLDDRRILKIYGARAQDPHRRANVERAVLDTVSNQIPAPRLIAAGTLEKNSPYLIMSEVAGETLQHLWADLSPAELRAIAGEIGTNTAQLHRLPAKKLATVETQYGGKDESVKEMKAERIAEIEAIDRFSTRHKDELLEFLHGKAQDFLDVPPVLTHADLSHAHIYLMRENRQLSVSGWIDWAEAMLGPAEWDIAFHWLWTFSQDRDTMRECLNTYYQDVPRPDQLALRCFATHLYTFSMEEVWDYFTEPVNDSESIVRAMVMSLFPPDVFGSSEDIN